MQTRAIIATLFVAGTLLFQPAAALADGLFDTGSIYFDYSEYPSGPYGGVFDVEGGVDFSDPDFPDGAMGCYGVIVEAGDAHFLLVIAAMFNLDDTIDAAVLLVSDPAPLAPGIYPFDPSGFGVNVAFLDNATGVTFPLDPANFDWEAWLSLIEADHLFVGLSGAIEIESLDPEHATGNFMGLFDDQISEEEFYIEMTSGEFEIGLSSVATEDSNWGAIKSLF